MNTSTVRLSWLPASICAISGVAVFQFLGNATHGYIHTDSLFYWWSYQWVNPESETQHGLLILAISAWLLIRNLRATQHDAIDRSAAVPQGCVAMIGGLLLHAAGFVAEQARVSIVGFLLFTYGIAAMGGGRRLARAAAFPVAFMAFAIPFEALDSIGFFLRMWVVGSSAWIAHLLGVAVLVNGTQILSPDGRYDYDVAAACSGVRSLVALAALSLLIGYLHFRPNWMRAAFLGLSFPLIFTANVVRILSIVVAAHLGGQPWGDRVHEIMGFGVFVIVLGSVLLAAEVSERIRPDLRIQIFAEGSSPPARTGSPTIPEGTLGRAWTAATFTVVVSIAVACLLSHVAHLPARGGVGIVLTRDGSAPIELPTFLGTDWIGKDSEVTELERQLLPPDTGFSRKIYTFIADPRNKVFLSIVLSGRDRTSIHRPELCLVGQGWTIRGSITHRFADGAAATFPATVLQVEKEVMTSRGKKALPQLVVYYFLNGDSIVATNWERILHDAWNRLIHGRVDRWAYVLVQTDDQDGNAAALGRIQAILDATIPAFQKHGGI